jgi:chromosome partitioning protein
VSALIKECKECGKALEVVHETEFSDSEKFVQYKCGHFAVVSTLEATGAPESIAAEGAVRERTAPLQGETMAVSVSLINMKGGVGKTTLAAQLAHTASLKGLRTLAVDLDPQANLSQALLSPEKYAKLLRDRKPTIVQLFEQYFPPTDEYPSPQPVDIDKIILKQVGHHTIATLHLIPSRLELSHTLKNPFGKERRLAKSLTKVADDYDLILIDCAPTESILTDAAYHASRYVLVPVKPEYLATIGLPLLARSIREFKDENSDRELDICGIVFNHSSSYSSGPEGERSIREVHSEAKKHGWHVFNTHVRYSRSYAKAAREGTPIAWTSYARWDVSKEFVGFVDEFFAAINLSKGTT